MEIDDLNTTFKDLDDIWISFQETIEKQKLLDNLDFLYNTLDQAFKNYWNRFSEAYRSGCDLYTGSMNLPQSYFNLFLIIVFASFINKELDID